MLPAFQCWRLVPLQVTCSGCDTVLAWLLFVWSATSILFLAVIPRPCNVTAIDHAFMIPP